MTRSLDTYAAVIFDMDGLMIDSERSARNAWRDFLPRWAGLPEGLEADELYSKITGLSARDAAEIVYGLLGTDFPFDTVLALEEQFIDRDLVREPKRMVKRGLEELLDLIEERGLLKAVATSTHKEVAVERLHKLKLLDRFQVVVGGDEVKAGKPDPTIYRLAAGRLGLAEEEHDRCIVLEDSLPGVRAALAAQMFVIQVLDKDLTLLKREGGPLLEANRTFDDLFEVKAFLKVNWLRTDAQQD